MEFDEYQRIAGGYASAESKPRFGKADLDDLTLCALGLCGESAEYYAASVHDKHVRELGDVLWYLAHACDVVGEDLARLAASPRGAWEPAIAHSPGVALVILACAFTDRVKKWRYHGHAYNGAQARADILLVLRAWLACCAADAVRPGFVAAVNVEKLRARYPQGFSHEASRFRESER